jgi:hypothetical protein
MKKTLIILAIIIATFLIFGGKFKWLIADMGWCQKYGYGLKFQNTVIFKFPGGPSFCV